MTTARTRHNYTGTSVAERQIERRALFIEAGLTVFAEKSFANSSLTDVCAAAGLSRRQFYEQFAGREELLVAVYDTVQGKARDAVAAALAAAETDDLRALIDAAVRAYTTAITDDIRCAKVAFVEIVGVSPAIEEHRAQVRDRWGEVVAAIAAGREQARTPPGGWRVSMAAFIGAVNGAVHQWSLDDPRPPVDELVEVFSTLLNALTTAEPPGR
ncbi:TetR/AcrR family transcriptional regulator [Nocardia rhizosphaerihabitans]|uniref:TetR family transcriptional regulator n=1 Tax=Nocardia rhizosphaerihabitans TaxID=1691570 RepID=A0ABQ2KYP3_9NOCA|nr:TetR/AcrR family transcriptional regulator [Nocardia rhizosphaerihabitans]GGN96915.1 TetR family transcriptional regulator [Nocardia rhizosphaerihabitans]